MEIDSGYAAFIIDQNICRSCLQRSADKLVMTNIVITTHLVLLQAGYKYVTRPSLRSLGGIGPDCWEETF